MLGQRDGEAPGPGRELEDRSAGPSGEGQVQVQVARVLGEVEVVEPGERDGLGGRRRGQRGRRRVVGAERVAVWASVSGWLRRARARR